MIDPVSASEAAKAAHHVWGMVSNIPGCHGFTTDIPEVAVMYMKALVGMITPWDFVQWMKLHFPQFDSFTVYSWISACAGRPI